MNTSHSPLTQSQLSLWTGQKLNPEVPLYNMAHSFDIQGTIVEEHFVDAFKDLIQRADALRTIFVEVDDIPFQQVLPTLDFDLKILDFTGEDETHIKEWMLKRSQLVFDLSKRLFDSVLIKINAERYIWYLNVHHLVTDATASTILYKLQTKLYKNLLEGGKEIVEETPQYSDYTIFESKQKESELSETIQDYWATKIDTLTKPVELYGRKNELSTSQAERVFLKLGAQRSQKLKEFAKNPEIRSWTQDLTLFNIFTTTLFILLYRVSGQKNLAIGAPAHNRTTKNFKQTPGLFIEVFPLVTEFKNDDSFLKVFNHIKIETNEYLRHAQPGMSTPTTSRSFNVVLNYINAAFPNFNGMAMTSEWIHTGHCDPGHQLRCHVYDMDASGEIEVYFDLNTDVFHEAVREELPNHFLKLLDALLEDIQQPILKPSLTKQVSKNVIEDVEAFNAIISQFEEQVAKTPTEIALRFKNEVYSYSELNQRANQLANLLVSKGIAPEKRVAIYLERSPWYLISVLAVMKTGATFIPIPSDQPSQRVAYILKDAASALVLTNHRLQANLSTDNGDVLNLDIAIQLIENQSIEFDSISIQKETTAYMIYTSGSTGNPKGVLISNHALSNYVNWAKSYYFSGEKFIFPLFTSVGFDLTITSTFLSLLTGGELIIYREPDQGPDISLMEVLAQNKVNAIKLTPSHLALIKGSDLQHSKIKTIIVGGEDFKTELAKSIQESFSSDVKIFNEYGPTEATVGCIVSQYNTLKHNAVSVAIGKPISGMSALILDSYKNQVPNGVIGELYLTGIGLAKGYSNLEKLTSEKFLENPFQKGAKIYKTGDLARMNEYGEFEYLGRVDEQVKLRGFRIELSDIEANLLKHKSVENSAVVLVDGKKSIQENEVINCSECGLPSNYPNTDFDEKGVCHVCNAFKGYKDQAQKYFKTEDELRKLLMSKRGESPNYDCISLLSGGKDSTYILAQLVEMGLKVLAFTLDNGYISEQAKGNIDRIVKKLNVDHIYGTTEYMNEIFVDSLHRHHNVCNGCFKTIYTLSTQIALKKEIPFVVTGLSRGQFFETRLTEELFWDTDTDVSTIDDTILEARKLYHQEEDAVKDLLDVSAFNNDETFDKVQFVDFYRYSDVRLEEMLKFLKEKVAWERPTDTGRSTNCLINQLGIHVHKKEKGYSNYSFPYSWDVRMGHKTRTETLEEINEVIDVKEVERIMQEIGYVASSESELEQKKLVGYYTGGEKVGSYELSNHLKQVLPEYMIPTYFKYMEELPLTKNGKVDKEALKALNISQLKAETPFIAPQGDIEELIAGIWKEVLRLEQVSVHDNFIDLGGHSLAAIRVTARINEEIEMKFPLNKIFELPTISEYSQYVEDTLVKLLNEQN